VGAAKLQLARDLGAAIAVDGRSPDAVAEVIKATGGVHGALVTAVSRDAFRQTLSMLRSGGTMALVGLPPGEFPTPIFEMVLKRLTIRGSIVGTRLDLSEALAFAGAGKVGATVEVQPFERVNEVLIRLRNGTVRGRVVLDMAG